MGNSLTMVQGECSCSNGAVTWTDYSKGRQALVHAIKDQRKYCHGTYKSNMCEICKHFKDPPIHSSVNSLPTSQCYRDT